MKSSYLIIGGIILSFIMGAFSYFHLKEQRREALILAHQQAEVERQERIKKIENIVCNQMFKGERPSEMKCLEIRVYRTEYDFMHDYWYFWLEMKGQRNDIIYDLIGRAHDVGGGLTFQFMEDNAEE